MRPHNQHAPGLGRLDDVIRGMAAKHRKHIDKERAEHDRKERDTA